MRAVSVDELELQGVVRELQGVRGELVGVLRGFVEVMRARHDVVLAAEGLQREPALSRVQRRNPGGRRLLGGDEPLVVGGEVGVVPLVLHRFVRVDLGFGEDALGAELPGRRARAHDDLASVHSRLRQRVEDLGSASCGANPGGVRTNGGLGVSGAAWSVRRRREVSSQSCESVHALGRPRSLTDASHDSMDFQVTVAAQKFDPIRKQKPRPVRRMIRSHMFL